MKKGFKMPKAVRILLVILAILGTAVYYRTDLGERKACFEKIGADRQ